MSLGLGIIIEDRMFGFGYARNGYGSRAKIPVGQLLS